MTTRSRRETVHFKHAFRIKGIDRLLSPGAYEVITDEEMIIRIRELHVAT